MLPLARQSCCCGATFGRRQSDVAMTDLRQVSRGAATTQRNRERIRRSGRTPNGYRVWTKGEKAIVRALYPDYDALVKALPGRTRNGIQCHARGSGMCPKIHAWTASEVLRLRKLYPHASRREVLAAFPGLGWQATVIRANKLGLRRAPIPLKKTGHRLVDEIRQRARDLHWTMADLDEIARTKGYFAEPWHSGNNLGKIESAVKVLGGRLVIQWVRLD